MAGLWGKIESHFPGAKKRAARRATTVSPVASEPAKELPQETGAEVLAKIRQRKAGEQASLKRLRELGAI